MERANRLLAKRSVPTSLPLVGLGQGLPASADKDRDSSGRCLWSCLSVCLARSRCLHQAQPTVASLEIGMVLSMLLAKHRSVMLLGRVTLYPQSLKQVESSGKSYPALSKESDDTWGPARPLWLTSHQKDAGCCCTHLQTGWGVRDSKDAGAQLPPAVPCSLAHSESLKGTKCF